MATTTTATTTTTTMTTTTTAAVTSRLLRPVIESSFGMQQLMSHCVVIFGEKVVITTAKALLIKMLGIMSHGSRTQLMRDSKDVGLILATVVLVHYRALGKKEP